MHTPISHLIQFGPTPFLFFTFVKKLIMFFFALAVISLIPICYNRMAGTEYSETVVGANVFFARTTIGAHSSASSNQHQAKVVNTFSAAVVLCVFFIFWLYWKHYLSVQKIVLRQDFPLASYRTVLV